MINATAVRLHVEHLAGVVGGVPIVLLHGFTGCLESWRPLAERIGKGRPVYGVDLPGHGKSPSPVEVEPYTMAASVESIYAALSELGIDRCDLVGYSFGGRVAMHVALARPDLVRALVLESAAPGVADAAERSARIAADTALAESIERDGVAAFVARWEALPLFATQRALPDAVQARVRQQRLAGNSTGLANSLRGAGAGAQEPLFNRLSELSPPTLVIAGALDTKYASLAVQMAATIPVASCQIIVDAGHTVHLERPDAFLASVNSFLDRLEVLSRR